MTAKPVKFVTVSTDPWTGIDDKPGSLARVWKALAEKGIRVEAFTVGPSGLRLLTADHRAAAQAIRAAGLNTEIADFLEMEVPSDPAVMARLTEELGRAKVSIVAAFGAPGSGTTRAYLRVDHTERAAPILARLAPQVTTR